MRITEGQLFWLICLEGGSIRMGPVYNSKSFKYFLFSQIEIVHKHGMETILKVHVKFIARDANIFSGYDFRV